MAHSNVMAKCQFHEGSTRKQGCKKSWGKLGWAVQFCENEVGQTPLQHVATSGKQWFFGLHWDAQGHWVHIQEAGWRNVHLLSRPFATVTKDELPCETRSTSCQR